MALKVKFSTGESTVTVKGLHQWDYGQVLEIECAEIGSEILEVHFACSNMSEAIVRTCTFSNGVGTVTMPDECLEQTSAVTAWVYEVDSTQGHTIKTIILPITARTRPSNTRDIVPSTLINDKYGQMIEEINEAVNALEKGEVTAAKAISADKASHATTAGSATNATYATSAGSATNATNATNANCIKGSLAGTVNISNGGGREEDLAFAKRGELYFVSFQLTSGSMFNGIFFFTSATYDSMCSMGIYRMNFLASRGINISADGVSYGDINGTLNFYKIGEI